MPYCPECGGEFQDWVKVCIDCHVELVDELPEVPVPEVIKNPKIINEPIVHLATAPNEPLAYMWAGILEEHGIDCMLKSGQFIPARYVFPYFLHTQVYVLSSQVEDAAEILNPLWEKLDQGIVPRQNNMRWRTVAFLAFCMILL